MRKIKDRDGMPLDEKVQVKIRAGRFRGRTGRVTHIRCSAEVYVRVAGHVGSWLASSSVEVIA